MQTADIFIQIEGFLLWVAVAGYTASGISILTGLIFEKEKYGRVGLKTAVAACGIETIVIILRWAITRHGPVLWTFEHSLAGSWVVMALFLAGVRWNERFRPLGVVIIPFAVLLMGYGIMSGRGHEALPPPYQSNWIWVHVIFAWVAYGAYHISCGLGIVYLLKRKVSEKGTISRFNKFYAKFPDLPLLNDIIFKFIIYGFIAHMVMISAGAIWAYGLWGSYWNWDPIETWSLISWLVYGANIHLRVTYGWNEKKGAWLAIGSLLGIIITFGGLSFIGGLHTPLL